MTVNFGNMLSMFAIELTVIDNEITEYGIDNRLIRVIVFTQAT